MFGLSLGVTVGLLWVIFVPHFTSQSSRLETQLTGASFIVGVHKRQFRSRFVSCVSLYMRQKGRELSHKFSISVSVVICSFKSPPPPSTRPVSRIVSVLRVGSSVMEMSGSGVACNPVLVQVIIIFKFTSPCFM